MDPEKVTALAAELLITDHVTGERIPWEPNIEQKLTWQRLAESRRVYVMKSRQVGLTTAVCLWDLLVTATRDARGDKYKRALVWDVEGKAMEKLSLIADFAEQLGIDCDPKAKRITFPGGSKIDILTAGSRATGRSLSYQGYHCSELPWWQQAKETWVGVQQSLGLEGTVVIETTMDMIDPLPRDLWVNPNDFTKLFLEFELHEEYRMNPEGNLRPEEEAWLREEGFTDRWAMAYWLKELLRNKCANDEQKAFREYPQIPEHAFRMASGRWIRRTPEVIDPVETLRVDSLDGGVWPVEIFRRAKHGSGQYVICVDTSEGKGLDSSTVVVLDKKDNGICAAFDSPLCPADDLAIVTHALQEEYTIERATWLSKKAPSLMPPVLVETNGPGKATATHCREVGCSNVIEIHTTKESKYDGLLATKRAIESGTCYGPQRLAEEADGLHVRDDTGEFKGPKDMCMAIGWGLRHIKLSPYSDRAIGTKVSRHRVMGKVRNRSGWM